MKIEVSREDIIDDLMTNTEMYLNDMDLDDVAILIHTTIKFFNKHNPRTATTLNNFLYTEVVAFSSDDEHSIRCEENKLAKLSEDCMDMIEYLEELRFNK